MRRWVPAAVFASMLLMAAVPARAQSADPSTNLPAEPSRSVWHRLEWSAIAGAAAVRNVGATFGGELALPLNDRLQVFGEGLWMADVVTRRRDELVATIRDYLQDTQGKPATGDIAAPAAYGGAGLRVILRPRGAVRPYVAFSAGAAHVAFTPAFGVDGGDLTSRLPEFGVVPGRDLTGEVTKFAAGGGGGLRFARGRWTIDAGVRVLSIRTPDQPINAISVRAALSRTF